MTSQLNVDTIVDKAGSGGTNVKVANTSVTVAEGGSATTTTVQGLAKSWSITSGTDATSDDSFNYTSNTDNGTGDYSHGLTNNMNSTSYSVPATCGQNSSAFVINEGRSTSSVRTQGIRHDNVNVDTDHAHTVHGDLA